MATDLFIMKKVLFVLSTLTIIGMLIAFPSCTKENKTEKDSMTVADYEFLGEMHNAFMSNVVNNYIAPNPANHSKNELMDEISEFNSAFAKQSRCFFCRE